MSLLVVIAVATVVGFLLIALVGRGGRGAALAGPVSTGELGWVRGLGVEGLERLLVALFSEMGFRTERLGRAEGRVDLLAVDPAPIRGGRLHVHGVLAGPGEPLAADDVRSLLEAVRADGAGKAVLVTLGALSDEARAAAEGAPVELLDGVALAALVAKHLPQVAATRVV